MLHNRRSATADEFLTDNVSGDSVEARIRQRVQQRFQARNAFYIHLAVFVILNAMLWLIWATTGHGYPWPIFITAIWAIGLGAQAWQVYQTSPDVASRIEAEVQRELEAEKSRISNRD